MTTTTVESDGHEIILVGMAVSALMELIAKGSITRDGVFDGADEGDPTYFSDLLEELEELEVKMASALVKAAKGTPREGQFDDLLVKAIGAHNVQ